MCIFECIVRVSVGVFVFLHMYVHMCVGVYTDEVMYACVGMCTYVYECQHESVFTLCM